jgi:transcriptional regulator with XRE-family HTH domain
MGKNSVDCTPVLDALSKFSDACGTQAKAAKRIGVAKGTLSKWFSSRSLSRGALQLLAAFDGDTGVAEAARNVLTASGVEVASFNFGHVASQLACAGGEPVMLLQMLQRKASIEDLEFGAAHDLASTFADAQYYNALFEVAREGFQQLPDHPLMQLMQTGYEELVFPEEPESYPEGPDGKVDWSKVDWEKFNEPYTRRSNAARELLDCAADQPMHRLFEEIVDKLYCRVRKRETGDTFTEAECLKVAALAAVDCYKLESTAMEAADTIRRAAGDSRGLATRPLYVLATKIYEICFLSRTFTISRLEMLADAAGEDQEAVKAMKEIFTFVHHALYLSHGVYYWGNKTSAKVNAHGSVIDFEDGRLVRSLAGKKKRLAPKQAIGRAKTIRRRSNGGS